MTPYERLMAEQWPTGRFGRGEPVDGSPQAPTRERPPESRPIRGWSPEEQAEHLAALKAFTAEGWRDTSQVADRKREYNREHARQTADLRRTLHVVPSLPQQDPKAA
ncbi:hypothetical protein [Streptomyces mirabilis]|uniref:hypothetical protein n=1 Tax=Streptomyces mirabilis TaxID=68239 RepID=UPI0033FC86B7